MDRGARWATVHGVTELDTAERLSLSKQKNKCQIWWAPKVEQEERMGGKCYNGGEISHLEAGMQGNNMSCVHAKPLQSRPTVCDPIDCRPPASSVLEIFQARILE